MDVGASNAEAVREFLRRTRDTHLDVDLFVVPVTVRPDGVGGTEVQPEVVALTAPLLADSPEALYAATV